jgi:hypothetical protein
MGPIDLAPIPARCEWIVDSRPGAKFIECGAPATRCVSAADRYNGHYCEKHLDAALKTLWPPIGPWGSHVSYIS